MRNAFYPPQFPAYVALKSAARSSEESKCGSGIYILSRRLSPVSGRSLTSVAHLRIDRRPRMFALHREPGDLRNAHAVAPYLGPRYRIDGDNVLARHEIGRLRNKRHMLSLKALGFSTMPLLAHPTSSRRRCRSSRTIQLLPMRWGRSRSYLNRPLRNAMRNQCLGRLKRRGRSCGSEFTKKERMKEFSCSHLMLTGSISS